MIIIIKNSKQNSPRSNFYPCLRAKPYETPSLAETRNTRRYCHDSRLDWSKLRTLIKDPGPPSSLIISTSTAVSLYTRSTAVDADFPSETTLLSAISSLVHNHTNSPKRGLDYLKSHHSTPPPPAPFVPFPTTSLADSSSDLDRKTSKICP